MQRLEERTAYSKELLRSQTFDFTGKDHMSLSRKTAPFPKDIAEARQLWQERVRYEYLEERLNHESPEAYASWLAARHTPIDLGLASIALHHEIVSVIDKRYNRILRNFHEWESDKVLEAYLTALARVYDPHSDYEDKETLENFSITMSLSLFGIGAVLTSDDDGYCKIVSLQPGAPAAKSKKIKENDRIVAVAQGTNEPVDAIEMPLTKVVDMIRGPKGTKVRLTIIPADSPDTSVHKVVTLERDEIKLEDQQAKAKLIEMPTDNGKTRRLGVIDLPSFYASFTLMGSRSRRDIKSATLDVDRLLGKLEEEHVDGVILDLRHNGGGSLPEAIDLTGLFIKEGPVVQVASSDGSVMVDRDEDPAVKYDGPLIVLTSRFSASASEIVAGALQDYGRALVVGGASTHGKGTVQSMSQLAPYLYMNGEFLAPNPIALGALKYTTNKFYRITGSSTQLKGVIPDIILPSSYDYMETEEGSEEYAMKWDEIKPTEYDKLNRVLPYLPELEKRSAARVAKSRDFAYVREDIDLVKKAMTEKSASLNEHQRLKEGAEAEARKKTRDAEMKARKPSDEKVYDLTLKAGEVVMVEEKKSDTNTVAVNDAQPSLKLTPPSDTNTTDTASAAAKPAPPELPNPEEKAPLDEAERILMDYISLMQTSQPLTAQQPQTQTQTN